MLKHEDVHYQTVPKIMKLYLNFSKLCLEYCGPFFPDTVYKDSTANTWEYRLRAAVTCWSAARVHIARQCAALCCPLGRQHEHRHLRTTEHHVQNTPGSIMLMATSPSHMNVIIIIVQLAPFQCVAPLAANNLQRGQVSPKPARLATVNCDQPGGVRTSCISQNLICVL